VNKFESMRIGIASPQKIRYWSFGEVEKLAGGEDEEGTLVEDIRHGRVQAVVNTMGNTRASLTTATDGFRIRQEAISRGIPLFTSLDTVAAILKVMQSRSFTTKNI
ncbi:hypothetical protein ACI3RH_08965, partial [Lactococcus lactis]